MDTNYMNQYFKYLMDSQPTGLQSLASTMPYFGVAKNLDKYMQPAQRYANAMVDLNSPEYQGLYGQFRQQGQTNLAESIAELSRQNRKLSLLGRAPLLDTERGGETIFRNLHQGYQDIQNNASGQALGQLQNAYTAQSQLGAQKQQNALSKAGFQGNIAGALAKLFRL